MSSGDCSGSRSEPSWVKYPATTLLPSRTRPEMGSRSPMATLIRVDFPAPFSPTIPHRSPKRTVQLNSLMSSSPGKPMVSFSAVTTKSPDRLASPKPAFMPRSSVGASTLFATRRFISLRRPRACAVRCEFMKRRTNSSIFAISISCRRATSAWRASSSSRSWRNFANGPG